MLLLAELRKDANSQPFLEPVPWKALQLWNYPTIIKKPMDLATVKNRLQKSHYKSLADFTADIQQIWINCKLYN